MNVFLFDFYTRLRAWHELKENLIGKDINHICVEVDKFWQHCPMRNHYLHPDDIESWPNPWELLNDNEFCYYARALGMVYTLFLLGIKDVDIVEAVDYNNNEVVLVLVDNAKYVLNYWPNTVVNNSLSEFTVTKRINTQILIKKTGEV
jgi:hypothetical protein